MNAPSRQPFNFRDIAHAAVLLILVPFVFYGGYKLVSHSADADPNSEHLGTQVLDKAKQTIDSSWNQSGPPPGTAWITEVDRLRNELASINLLDASRIEQRNRLDDQLRSIRQHCETHSNVIHSKIDSRTPLGQTLATIRDEVLHLHRTTTTSLSTESWKAAYETSESRRIADQSAAVRSLYDEQAIPMRQAHAIQLASLTRRNREIADELQRTLDAIQQIERDTREKISKRQRLEAYLKDKDELERLLKPFTSPAYLQLGEHWNDWQRRADKQPLSYRDLERVGALADDIEGIRILSYVGGMPSGLHPNSARPLGSFPKWYENTLSIPAHLEAIKRAQQLIRVHSVYLIEAGLLQP